ncbi:NACHT family domain (NACHT) [Commensalibacter communis]|uniref:NACHT domain-containing protein n=1 Tax=Commensalibacter communis TaxID=2972786 RepID=UPI0022FFB751|nr:NACHT domain-containing protein [Commensalibacter communis]CAI3924328.1 NACHT family domain (NACHT) [Commensalibacter communis]CAI3934822.1 NACHT family domain (NACHT) [Commensalibacter communis]
MIITSSIVAGWAVQAGIRKVVDTSIDKAIKTKWKSIFSKGKTIVEQLSQQETYDIYLEKHLYSTMKMRTIHSADKDVLLNEIYHPLAIKDRENSLLIEDGFIYENNEITNIIGYAGQGKSTILRKIFLEALTYGKKIPFFMVLRRIESDGVIKSLNLILDQFRIKASQEDMENLLESGNILLLLDGFDEVKTEYRNQLLKEIFHLNKKYNTQIIITSRHDTEICLEAGVRNFYVQHIDQEDIISIIKKLNRNYFISKGDYDNISIILEDNKNFIKAINTPLLTTLFYYSNPHLDNVPTKTLDFYQKLFDRLYSRHDFIKTLSREKKANLNKEKAYNCFCALCFLSIYNNELDFTEISILKYIGNAAKLTNIKDISAYLILDDFITITSLIQRDGYDHIVFLHKSVAEFHASQFVYNSSIKQKTDILHAMYKKISNQNYHLYPLMQYLYTYSEQDVITNILIPLCKDIGFDNFGKNRLSIINECYTLLNHFNMRISYIANDDLLFISSSNTSRFFQEKGMISEIFLKLDFLAMFTYDFFYKSYVAHKISRMVHSIYSNVLEKNKEHLKSVFFEITDEVDDEFWQTKQINFNEFIKYLASFQNNELSEKMEKFVNQIYNDTYIQYQTNIEHDTDDLMEFLHIE